MNESVKYQMEEEKCMLEGKINNIILGLVLDGKGNCYDAVCFRYLNSKKARKYITEVRYIDTIKDYFYSLKEQKSKTSIRNFPNLKKVSKICRW